MIKPQGNIPLKHDLNSTNICRNTGFVKKKNVFRKLTLTCENKNSSRVSTKEIIVTRTAFITRMMESGKLSRKKKIVLNYPSCARIRVAKYF